LINRKKKREKKEKGRRKKEINTMKPSGIEISGEYYKTLWYRNIW